MHADRLGTQEHPDSGLIFEIWTRRIAKAVAFPAITRSEAVWHGHCRRIREAPVLAYAPMQPFGARFRGLDRQSLQSVREQITAGRFALFRSSADPRARRNHE